MTSQLDTHTFSIERCDKKSDYKTSVTFAAEDCFGECGAELVAHLANVRAVVGRRDADHAHRGHAHLVADLDERHRVLGRVAYVHIVLRW